MQSRDAQDGATISPPYLSLKTQVTARFDVRQKILIIIVARYHYRFAVSRGPRFTNEDAPSIGRPVTPDEAVVPPHAACSGYHRGHAASRSNGLQFRPSDPRIE